MDFEVNNYCTDNPEYLHEYEEFVDYVYRIWIEKADQCEFLKSMWELSLLLVIPLDTTTYFKNHFRK